MRCIESDILGKQIYQNANATGTHILKRSATESTGGGKWHHPTRLSITKNARSSIGSERNTSLSEKWPDGCDAVTPVSVGNSDGIAGVGNHTFREAHNSLRRIGSETARNALA